MNTVQKLILYITSILIVTTIAPFGSSFAQISQTKLSPTATELSFSKGGESRNIELTITNGSTQAVTYKLSVVDFEPMDNGQPKLLFGDEQNIAYSLKAWFEPQPDLLVPAQSTGKVSLHFTVPENAKNQTYYGSILFTPTSETDANSVQSGGIGSLLFMNIGTPSFSGRVVEASFSEINQQDDQINTEFSVELFNDGNYKFSPQVSVEIIDSAGKVVDTLDFGSVGSTLPNSNRVYTAEYSGSLDQTQPWSFRPVVLINGQTINTNETVEFYAPEVADATTTPEAEQTEDTALVSRSVLLIVLASIFAVVLAVVASLYKKQTFKKSDNVVDPSTTGNPTTEAPSSLANSIPSQEDSIFRENDQL